MGRVEGARGGGGRKDALGAGKELPWFREGGAGKDFFTIDPELGFRPVLGSRLYDKTGCWRNALNRSESERSNWSAPK